MLSFNSDESSPFYNQTDTSQQVNLTAAPNTTTPTVNFFENDTTGTCDTGYSIASPPSSGSSSCLNGQGGPFGNDTLTNVAGNWTTGSEVPIYWSAAGAFFGFAPTPGQANASTKAGVQVEVEYNYSQAPSVGTPEPATLLLLGSGLSFVAARLRRRASGR